LNAYVFASSATPAAIEELRSGVGSGGPARVVCPLHGGRKLYVAVAAPDEAALRERVDAVLSTDGVGDADAYYVAGEEAGPSSLDTTTFPTYAAVDAHVGFALVVGTEAAALAASPPAVIGLAVATDGTVIVEMTGDNQAQLRQALNAIPGAVTAVGATADGAGFRRA
jgi:hypothetical protein